MTEPERPADAPTGSPTPEEISARLEALLRRTHALRAQSDPVGAGAAPHVTWPPPEGELDRYDVVDVPDHHRTKAIAAAAAPGDPGPASTPPPSGREGPDFTRPDWSELRLRASTDESPARSPWLGLLTALLAIVALGEAAYIWHLQTSQPAPTRGQLRVDGPAGAAIRLDGRALGAAPIVEALEPGDYDVEVLHEGAVFRVEDVSVGLGRTVVLMVPTGGTPAPGDGPSPPTPAAPGTAAAATGAAAVSETTGAVAIESTPSGLPVTMGGRSRGVTPLTLGQIRPGRHDVLVGGLARQVDITAGQVTTLRVIR